MRKIIYLVLPALLICGYACNMPKYIPVESVKTEYRDNYIRDSIYRYDSIYVKEKGDTLIFERYRYLYRDKLIRDSVFVCDTIRVPYPVEIVKQVKKPLTGWQNFQVWCGRIALSIVLGIIAYFVFRKLRIKPLIINH